MNFNEIFIIFGKAIICMTHYLLYHSAQQPISTLFRAPVTGHIPSCYIGSFQPQFHEKKVPHARS